jgi:hypothetical protein
MSADGIIETGSLCLTLKILLYILKTYNPRKSWQLSIIKKEVNSDAPDKKTGQWRGKDSLSCLGC